MPFCTARQSGFVSSRHAGLAALLLLLAAPIPQAASAPDTRTITLHHIHTGQDITITYKKNGQFDEDALKKLNTFVRDWRKEEEVRMDPQLYDYMWEVQHEVGHKGAIHIICGYRSPQTNAMLRSRSGGVARTSLHMQGKAMDFSLPGADVAEVRAAALRIQGGGVGYYPTSGVPFVHMDVGSVRHWPRMTRDQLAKVFPNGRTLHVPTDGNPLPGYELAQADADRSVNRHPSQPRRSLLAALFSGSRDVEEAGDNEVTPAPAKPAAAPRRTVVAAAAPVAAPAAEPVAVAAAPVPLPQSRPVFQVAAASERIVPAPAPRPRATNLASLSPNQIIGARGYWQGLPDNAADEAVANVSSVGRSTTGTRTASADINTSAAGPFAFNDRVPPGVALAYATEAEPTGTLSAVTTQGTASVASKARAPSSIRSVNAVERMQDPWLRGVVMASSLHTGMTTTQFGAPDFRALRPFLQKPAAAVMMTFNADPYLGMTTQAFTGSAVVFQATVTFGMRTALLQQ